MTAVLCTASDVKMFMRVTSTGDDTLIQGILDATEDLFLKSCGRSTRPFATSATGRTEVLDGTGTAQLMVDYPIAAITSIKLGLDSSDPDETLTTTDVNYTVFATGKRGIYRTDGGKFRERNETRVVQVVYNHDADQPDVAKLAVKRACAAVYRQIGSEDAKSEAMPDGYSRTIQDVCAGDPIWGLAVDATWEPRV